MLLEMRRIERRGSRGFLYARIYEFFQMRVIIVVCMNSKTVTEYGLYADFSNKTLGEITEKNIKEHPQ